MTVSHEGCLIALVTWMRIACAGVRTASRYYGARLVQRTDNKAREFSLAPIHAERWLLPAASILVSTWPCCIHRQGSVTQCGPIEPGNGLLRVFLPGHLDEAKALTSPGVTVRHDVGIDHFTKFPKYLCKLSIVHCI